MLPRPQLANQTTTHRAQTPSYKNSHGPSPYSDILSQLAVAYFVSSHAVTKSALLACRSERQAAAPQRNCSANPPVDRFRRPSLFEKGAGGGFAPKIAH